MTFSLHISQARYLQREDSAFVTGWVSDITAVSKIVLQCGNGEIKAILGVSRPDVLANHPRVGTQYCGFEAVSPATADESLTLLAYDHKGALLKRMITKYRPLNQAAADDRLRIVGRVHESTSGYLTVIVRAQQRTNPHLALQVGDVAPVPLIVARPNAAKSLYKDEPEGVVYLIGRVAIAAEELEPEQPFVIHVDSKPFVVSDLPPISYVKAFRGKIHLANWAAKTGVLKVAGSTNLASVSSFRLLVGKCWVGGGSVYLDPNATEPAKARAHFSIEVSVSGMDVTAFQATVELLAGDQVVQTMTAAIRPSSDASVTLPGSPISDTYAAIAYSFPLDPARAALPWVMISTSMTAWPSTGGATARTYALARYLKEAGYRVALVALRQKGAHDWVAELRDICDVLYLVNNEPEGDKFGHIDVSNYRRSVAPAMAVLRTIEAVLSPRAIIVNYAFNMYGTLGLKSPVILDAHDVQYKRTENARQNGGNLEDRRCTRREESLLLAMPDSILAISEDDVVEIEALAPGKPVILTPHAQEPLPVTEITAQSLKRIFFVGQKYAPNIDGIRNFIENVWKDLKAADDAFELHIVGRVCEALTDLKEPGIFLHGQVPSLDEFYETCGIAINPTPYGTGAKIKTIEGLGRGRCVLVTEEGRRGVPADAPLITAAVSKFREHILELSADPEKGRALGAQAAQYARAHFGPAAAYAPLLSRIEALSTQGGAFKANSGAQFVGHTISGSDIVLEFDMPPSEHDRPLTVTVSHAGRAFIKITRAIAKSAGAIAFRFPIPIWLADGDRHEIGLSWDSQAQASLEFEYNREAADLFGFVMPSWAPRTDAESDIWLLEPPLDPGAQQTIDGGQKLRSFKVRNRTRLAGLAWGWVPDSVSGDAVLGFLNFNEAVTKGNAKDVLSFYDYETGAVSFTATRETLWQTRAVRHQLPAQSLEALNDIWRRAWPVSIPPKGGVRLASFVEMPAVLSQSQGHVDFARLAIVAQPAEGVQTLSLQFPAQTPEQEIVRWQVFLNGIPQQMKKDLVADDAQISAEFVTRIARGEVATISLQCYPESPHSPRPAMPAALNFS